MYIRAVPRVFASFLLCLLGVGATSPKLARAEAPLRVIVPMFEDARDGWLERLRGQLSDLPVSLDVRPQFLPRADLTVQVQVAILQGRAERAHAVAWITEASTNTATTWLVVLATPSDGRVLVREIDSDRPAVSATSAVFEAAALVTRAALRVLVQGGQVGVVPASTPAPASSTISPSETDRAAPAEQTSKASSSSTFSLAHAARNPSAPLATEVSGGYQVALDGQAPRAHHAIAGMLLAGDTQWRFGITGSRGFGSQIRDRDLATTLTRHTAGATSRLHVFVKPNTRVELGLTLGVSLWQRETRALTSRATARSEKVSAALWLGSDACASRRFGPMWLKLGLGIDVVPNPPRFIVESAAAASKPQEVHPLWFVQPRAFLLLSWEPG